MPMWGGYWGGPWAGFGWVFPVIALLGMGLMMFLCCRVMGRMGCWGRAVGGVTHPDAEVGELLDKCLVEGLHVGREDRPLQRVVDGGSVEWWSVAGGTWTTETKNTSATSSCCS